MLLNKQAASNFQLVEVIVPANSPNQRINFPDQPILRDKVITKIEWISGGVLFSPIGNLVVLPTPNAFLTLATENGEEFLQNQPLYENSPVQVNNSFWNFNGTTGIANRKIVFPKSYITYAAATPVVTAYSILFGVYYN